MKIVDLVAPMVEFKNNLSVYSQKSNFIIKHKLNLRKRLIKKLKVIINKEEMKTRINNFSQEIKQHYKNEKKKAIRKNIIPGNSKSLWDAVNVAKNINCNTILTII